MSETASANTCKCFGCNPVNGKVRRFSPQMRMFFKWSHIFRKKVNKAEFKIVYKTLKKSMARSGYSVYDLLKYCNTCQTPTVLCDNDIKRDAAAHTSCITCNNCKTCCKCVSCVGCENRYKAQDFCQFCKKCRNGCCNCIFCNVCQTECHNNYCERCLRCDSIGGCCKCNGIKFFNNAPYFHKAPANKRVINTTTRFIAAEIEVAGLGAKGREIVDTVKRWNGAIVHDGSLPKESGFEINTAPALGDLYIDEITDICDKLNNAKAFVNEKCGLHVHVDARDYNYYSLRRLIRIYATIESALFSLVPAIRKTSQYCLPCGEKYEKILTEGKLPYKKMRGDILKSVYETEENTRSLRRDKYVKARYNALNLHSWFFRGTIESRMFPGTVDADTIIQWGILWATILDYAAKVTDSEVSKHILRDRPFGNLLTIAGDNAKLVQFMKECYTINNPHKNVADVFVL